MRLSAPLPGRTARDADSTLLFGLFALLLAFSLILHQLWWDGFEATGHRATVTTTCSGVVDRQVGGGF